MNFGRRGILGIPHGGPSTKISALINGKHSSVSLEAEFYAGLKEYAASRNLPLRDVITEIDAMRREDLKTWGNLSSTLRIVVLRFYQAKAKATLTTTPGEDTNADRK